MNPDLQNALISARANCGFLTQSQVFLIAQHDRLRQCLVRCGGGRFTCAAQDVEHFVACVVAGGDYVRDISLPTTDAIYSDKYLAPIQRMAEFNARIQAKIKIMDATHPEGWEKIEASHFNENDCGGVFDGNGVISDADPGL